MNMVLGEVEETVTTMEVDEETFEEMIKVPPHPSHTHPDRVPPTACPTACPTQPPPRHDARLES